MKARIRQIQCDEDELLELPDDWMPVRLERNSYWVQGRKEYTLFVLERIEPTPRATGNDSTAPLVLVS